MKQVSFISVEDEDPDLILAFAVWHPELDDIRSLILLRTPKYEVFLDEAERGVNVSYDARMSDEDQSSWRDCKSAQDNHNGQSIRSRPISKYLGGASRIKPYRHFPDN
jgi:hypothetical protein